MGCYVITSIFKLLKVFLIVSKVSAVRQGKIKILIPALRQVVWYPAITIIIW